MSDSVFRTSANNYFLLRATFPHDENVVLTVFSITAIEWAEAVPQLAPVPEPEFGWESVAETDPYLRVDVWPKYFFPTFGSVPVGDGHAYQWYGLEEAAELHELLTTCVRQAAAHGVVVGSR